MTSSSWKTIQTKVIFEARNPDEISFRQDEIELPSGAGLVGVRDTKNRTVGHLEVSRAAWASFVRFVR